MTHFEKEQLIQLKKMEMNQLVNSSFNNVKSKSGFLEGFANLSANKNNLRRVKELKLEIIKLESIETTD